MLYRVRAARYFNTVSDWTKSCRREKLLIIGTLFDVNTSPEILPMKRRKEYLLSSNAASQKAIIVEVRFTKSTVHLERASVWSEKISIVVWHEHEIENLTRKDGEEPCFEIDLSSSSRKSAE